MEDPLHSSQIIALGPKEKSKFERRLTSWLLFFYRGDDDHLKKITPAVEKLRNDFKGVIEIARVNCD